MARPGQQESRIPGAVGQNAYDRPQVVALVERPGDPAKQPHRPDQRVDGEREADGGEDDRNPPGVRERPEGREVEVSGDDEEEWEHEDPTAERSARGHDAQVALKTLEAGRGPTNASVFGSSLRVLGRSRFLHRTS